MIKWHSFLEYIQFPLKVLFFATMLLGVGNIIINPNVSFLWSIQTDWIIRLSELLRYLGGFLYTMFPLFVFIKVLTRKFEDSVPVYVGLFSFITLLITMTFFTNAEFPAYFYQNTLGIVVDIEKITLVETGIPFNIGIFGLLIAYYITSRLYRKSRRHNQYGLFSFVDHDAWAMIIVFITSLICGIALAYLWPLVIQGIQSLFTWIGTDITNPINLFVYGIFERLSAPLGMINIPREVFWFTELGGSWMDSFGMSYLGDVNIYSIQQSVGTFFGTAGRFITPYYIINMFMVPAFYMAYQSMVSNKRDRRRYRIFFLLACMVSIFAGNPLPMELYILFMAPVLYIVYILMVGTLYALLSIANVMIGFGFSGMLITALPGSGIDLLQYLRLPDMYSDLVTLVGIGLVFGILFYLLTKLYFKKYAIGFFELHTVEDTANDVIFALGGIENIEGIDSTPDKLMVELKDKDTVDLDTLNEMGAYLIFESKDGYLIRLGNISTIVRQEIEIRLYGKKTKTRRKGR
ncbi:MAG: hypothetical protein ACRCZJ_06010 [Erysipelotrichaceae bacterium]